MSDKSSNFVSLQEKNKQSINNISQLQIQEKELYDKLNDGNLNAEQKQQIINKINEISQIRMNMYSSLKDMYSFYYQNVSESRTTLDQSIAALDILENELNQSKMKLNLIEEQKNNKLRLVEINTYYGKRYNAHSTIMKTIVLICIPVIMLAILGNKGILPLNIYISLIIVVLVIGSVIIGLQVIDISNRDENNWDEYNWYFDKSKAPKDKSSIESKNKDPWESITFTCIGSSCCHDGSYYDNKRNVCVSTNENIESFSKMNQYGNSPVKSFSLVDNVSPIDSSLSKMYKM